MNYYGYLGMLDEKFKNIKDVKIIVNSLDKEEIAHDTKLIYAEVFKWKWIATKLKIFTFISHIGNIKKEDMQNYSKACLEYSLKNMPGLKRGMQNGVVSNNIIVSDHVDDDAIAYVEKRPDKHFSAFEFPIILDLSKGNIYFYNGDIYWGRMYMGFMKKYILDNFNIPGGNLV